MNSSVRQYFVGLARPYTAETLCSFAIGVLVTHARFMVQKN